MLINPELYLFSEETGTIKTKLRICFNIPCDFDLHFTLL